MNAGRVGSDARASAAVLRGDELRRYVWLSTGKAIQCRRDETVAVVLFDNGVD